MGGYPAEIYHQGTLPLNHFYAERYLRPHWRRVLDLGCGDGTFSAPLALKRVEVWGLDPSPVALHRLQERGIPGLLSVAARGDGMPFPDHFFDAAIFAMVIEHLADPIPTLRELHRVLKPQGDLVVTTDGRYTYLVLGALEQLRGRGRLDPTHINLLTPRKLRSIMASASFDVREEFLQFPVRASLWGVMPPILARTMHFLCSPRSGG